MGHHAQSAPDRGFTTVELKINVLGAGRLGDELVGIGELLHAGARTQVWEVRVYRGEEGGGADGAGPGRFVANFLCTQMIL